MPQEVCLRVSKGSSGNSASIWERVMPLFDPSEKRHRINIFKLGGAYYFKHFFEDPDLFRELEPFYEKARYMFKIVLQVK